MCFATEMVVLGRLRISDFLLHMKGWLSEAYFFQWNIQYSHNLSALLPHHEIPYTQKF